MTADARSGSLTGLPGDGVVPGAVAMSSMVEPDPHSFTRFQRFAMRAIGWYQRSFSFRPSPCRFSPSCSVYSAEAIAVHGSRRGLWLAVKRLARCRPFGPSGWDPVPTPDRSSPLPESDVATVPSSVAPRPPRSRTKAR